VQVREALGDAVEYRRIETVGPTVSAELARAGTIAVLVAIFAIMVYIWFRFEWQFAIGAVVALVHDVVLTIGMFSLLQLDFALASIAAILTIVGYSLNDTVVVYDRVRENLRRYKKMPMVELLDVSINQMLAAHGDDVADHFAGAVALYIFGGEVIRSFVFAMIWGVIVGTYSSSMSRRPCCSIWASSAAPRGEGGGRAGGMTLARPQGRSTRHADEGSPFSRHRADRRLWQRRVPLCRACRIPARSWPCPAASTPGRRTIPARSRPRHSSGCSARQRRRSSCWWAPACGSCRPRWHSAWRSGSGDRAGGDGHRRRGAHLQCAARGGAFGRRGVDCGGLGDARTGSLRELCPLPRSGAQGRQGPLSVGPVRAAERRDHLYALYAFNAEVARRPRQGERCRCRGRCGCNGGARPWPAAGMARSCDTRLRRRSSTRWTASICRPSR
jgi:preprotein translocase SecF subunit